MTGYFPVGGNKKGKSDLKGDVDVIDKIEEPNMWKIILINDNYTSMDCVVEILMYVFYKPRREADEIMLTVHNDGKGIAGIYPKEIAETKKRDAEKWASENEYPLKLVMEEDK